MSIITKIARGSADLALFLAASLALLSLGGFWKNRLDVLTHFSPVWFVLCAAGLFLLVLLRRGERPLLRALAVGGMVASGALMAPELAAALRQTPLPPAESHRRIRIVEMNLFVRNVDPAITAQWLLKSGADILILPEPEGAAAPIVRRLRAGYPHGIDCQTQSDCNAAVLSRWPAMQSGSAHPYAWARFRTPGGPVTVIGAHYTWPTNGWQQQWQRDRVAALIRSLNGEDLIVAGDFNLTPWSYAMRRQDRAFGLERRTRALVSWPGQPVTRFRIPLPFPILPIDHLYASDAWRTVSVRRGPRLGSDHYPVIVELSRAPAG